MHLPSRRPGGRPNLAMTADPESGVGAAQRIIGVGMSVAPFMPPPFGVVATGTLALYNFLLGQAQATTPPPNPFSELKDSLDAFYTDSKLNTQLGKLAGQHANFVNSTVVQRLTTPIDQLSKADIDGQIQDLLDDLGDTSKDGMLSKVSDANDQIWQLLQQCNTDNFEATLGSLISGITLQLVLQNAAIEILAINGSFFYRQKDMLNYSTYVSKMTGRVGTAANEIGTTHIGAWDDDAIKEGLQSTSRITQIEAWMAQAKEQRLKQVSDVHRFSYQASTGSSGSYTTHGPKTIAGWSWNDAHDPNGQSDVINLSADTDGTWPWSDPVDHKDPAVTSHDNYFNNITKQIDDGFEPHREQMKTWLTFLDGFHELLPPPEPPSPSACPMQSGSAVYPQGPWVEGADVRYALMAVSKSGPSPLSDWSDSFKIGKTAFRR